MNSEQISGPSNEEIQQMIQDINKEQGELLVQIAKLGQKQEQDQTKTKTANIIPIELDSSDAHEPLTPREEIKTLAKERANTILERLREEDENRKKKALDILIKKEEDRKNKLEQIRKEAEKEAEMEKINKEKGSLIAGELYKFKIDLADLEQMPGYNDLSAEQMCLVLENLKQVTYSNVKDRAVKDYKEDVSKSGFLKKIWKGLTKNYQVAKFEKAEMEKIQKGGLECYKEDLQQLTKGMRDNNLNVIKLENGELEIQYIDGISENLNEARKNRIKRFNAIATEFSKIPYEWSLGTATANQQKEYKEEKRKYEIAKQLILNAEKDRIGEEEVVFNMNDIDRKVQYNQFLQAHPEIEKEIKEMMGNKAQLFLKSSLNLKGLEHAGYFGAGFGLRCLTVSVFGLLYAPITAGGIAGFLANKRAHEHLKQIEKEARRGEANYKNIKTLYGKKAIKKAQEEINRLRKEININRMNRVDEIGNEKRQERIVELEKITGGEQKEVKNFVEAGGENGVNEKIDSLINRINKETDQKKIDKLLNSLKVRKEYVENKIRDGLVNFGEEESRLSNQLALMQSLGQAESLTFFLKKTEGVAPKKILENRIESFLGIRKKRIEKAQKKYVVNKMVKGAIFGAGFAAAGWAVRHFAGELFNRFVIDKDVNLPILPTETAEVEQQVPEVPKVPVVGGAEQQIVQSEDAMPAMETAEVEQQVPEVPKVPVVGGAEQQIVQSEDAMPAMETAEVEQQVPEVPKVPVAGDVEQQNIIPTEKAGYVIQKGQGVWHGVRAQLKELINNNPEKYAERFHLSRPFDSLNSAEQAKILDRETMNILEQNEIVKNGVEVRISNVGTRIILDPETNNISIVDEHGGQAKTYPHRILEHKILKGHILSERDVPIIDKNVEIISGTETLTPDNSITWIENGPTRVADIPYNNAHELRITMIDTDGDNAPNTIEIFDKYNKSIVTMDHISGGTKEDFFMQATEEANKFLEERAIRFSEIVGESGITSEQAESAGMDFFASDISDTEKAQLAFWSQHIDMLPKSEVAKSFFELSQNSGVRYNMFDFQHAFENMPAGLKPDQKIGYVKIFAGATNQRQDGLIKLFGNELLGGKTDITSSIKKGVLIIKDAFGHKGYNILLSQDKIGVDGQGLLNWGTKGHFGNIRPDNALTPDMINMAKTKIESFVKMMAEKPAINKL